LRSDLILSLQQLVRDELALLRRLGIDRRKASILLPVLRRTALPSGRAARRDEAAKPEPAA
jgi:hypothetical protein